MTRDLRDPQALGDYLLWCRNEKSFNAPTLSVAYDAHSPEFWEAGGPFRIGGEVFQLVPDWKDDGFMSSNPAFHHSKVDQTIGDLTE